MAYRLGLLLVTVAMIVVPLLYVAFMAAVGWLLVWHVTTNTWILADSVAQIRLVAYLTPAVVLATLLFFLVKPFIARRAASSEPVQIREEDEPVLHALIREVSRHVRAPVPARVFVDCDVNASASLRGGPLGVWRREVDLTIGLPLMTGLSVRQLSGVLAHEFGHFAQRGGMRMWTLIRALNDWLFRVAHERDTWDDTLDEWSEREDFRVIVPMALARWSVWVSRRMLSAVATVDHRVSCYMLRQMELDADSYQAKVAGAETFENTVIRVRELLAGSEVAHAHLAALLERNVAPVDFPRFVVDSVNWLPDDARAGIRKTFDEPTRAFDTHPSDADRVAAARRLGAPGTLVGGDEPATDLFRHLAHLSEAVSRHHYEHGLGLTLEHLRLVTPDEARLGAHDLQHTEAAVRDAFASRISLLRPLRLTGDEAAASHTGNIAEDFARAGDAIRASQLSEDAYRAYEQLVLRDDLAFCAEQLFLLGVERLDGEQFSLDEPTLGGAQALQRWAQEQQHDLRAELDPFDDLVARRLTLGTLLLERHGDAGGGAHSLLRALATLADAVTAVTAARRPLMLATLLEQLGSELGSSVGLGARLGELSARLDQSRVRVLSLLAGAHVPDGDLGDRWRWLLANASDLHHDDFMQRVLDLYWACLARLTSLIADGERRQAHDDGA